MAISDVATLNPSATILLIYLKFKLLKGPPGYGTNIVHFQTIT